MIRTLVWIYISALASLATYSLAEAAPSSSLLLHEKRHYQKPDSKPGAIIESMKMKNIVSFILCEGPDGIPDRNGFFLTRGVAQKRYNLKGMFLNFEELMKTKDIDFNQLLSGDGTMQLTLKESLKALMYISVLVSEERLYNGLQDNYKKVAHSTALEVSTLIKGLCVLEETLKSNVASLQKDYRLMCKGLINGEVLDRILATKSFKDLKAKEIKSLLGSLVIEQRDIMRKRGYREKGSRISTEECRGLLLDVEEKPVNKSKQNTTH